MEKEDRRKMNGWEFLAVAVIYLPLIWLASKVIDKKEKEKEKQ